MSASTGTIQRPMVGGSILGAIAIGVATLFAVGALAWGAANLTATKNVAAPVAAPTYLDRGGRVLTQAAPAVREAPTSYEIWKAHSVAQVYLPVVSQGPTSYEIWKAHSVAQPDLPVVRQAPTSYEIWKAHAVPQAVLPVVTQRGPGGDRPLSPATPEQRFSGQPGSLVGKPGNVTPRFDTGTTPRQIPTR
jgi:hypothetical protein